MLSEFSLSCDGLCHSACVEGMILGVISWIFLKKMYLKKNYVDLDESVIRSLFFSRLWLALFHSDRSRSLYGNNIFTFFLASRLSCSSLNILLDSATFFPG